MASAPVSPSKGGGVSFTFPPPNKGGVASVTFLPSSKGVDSVAVPLKQAWQCVCHSDRKYYY